MISVIIPTYNRGNRITESIKSVLNQTYSDLELIVIDDGSTDNTSDVVNNIHDCRLLYYKQDNKGACAARNYGIKLAKGEYIAFQDSDDTWEPNKLEIELDLLESKNCDLVYCGLNRIMQNKVIYIPEGHNDYETIDIQKLLTQNRISTQTILMKTSVAREVLFDESFKRLQDWDFALRVCSSGYKIDYVNQALVRSEVQEDSITSLVPSEQAYLFLLKKHEDEYYRYPEAIARLYSIIAYRLKDNDRKKAIKYLKKSFMYNKKLSTVIKLLLICFRAWN